MSQGGVTSQRGGGRQGRGARSDRKVDPGGIEGVECRESLRELVQL